MQTAAAGCPFTFFCKVWILKALVTGAGGFLGLYLVEQLLARGDTVRTFSRRSYDSLDALPVENVQGDLQHQAATMAVCEDIDVVFHNAGVAGIWGPWKHFHGINTLGSEHILQGCIKHGVKALVYTSSPSVTFNGGHQSGVDETEPYPQRWLCHYPHTKALAEQAILKANGTGSLTTCALRPHLIWGPRDQHLIPRLLDRARKGALRIVGDGKNMIDMIYVENAAQAHLQAADALLAGSQQVAGSAYFLSQDQPVNCWDWINSILKLAGAPPVTQRVSFNTAWRIGAAMEAAYKLCRIQSEPRMTRFLAAQLARDHYFNISNARNDFGYTPQISTEEGMQRLKASLQP